MPSDAQKTTTEIGSGDIGLELTRTLVMSQVILSFGIPFALVPLVLFTRRKEVMGELVNHRLTTGLPSIVAGLIIALNTFLRNSTWCWWFRLLGPSQADRR